MKFMMIVKHKEGQGFPPKELMDAIAKSGEEAAKAGNRCRGNGIVVSIIDILTLCGSDQTRVGNLYDCPGFYKLDECAVHLDPRDTEVALRFGAVGYEQEGAKFPPAISLMSEEGRFVRIG